MKEKIDLVKMAKELAREVALQEIIDAERNVPNDAKFGGIAREIIRELKN